MSERLPYEGIDQQFNDLPLPDENASWQKMKEMLDDDDDNIVPPPVFLRSCLGWGMVLLVGLTIAWLTLRPEKWWSKTSVTQQASSPVKPRENSSGENLDEKTTNKLQQKIATQNKRAQSTDTSSSGKSNNKNAIVVPGQNEKTSFTEHHVIHKNKQSTNDKDRKNGNSEESEAVKISAERSPQIIPGDAATKEKKSSSGDSLNAMSQPHTDFIPTDTAKKNNVSQPEDSITRKKIKTAPKKFFLVAGVGEQQQIPVAGQTTVPYSHYGRKGSLSDYVPSVFIQLQKEKKWFVLGEFRYGAPQSVKEFSYNRKTNLDTLTNNISITSLRLKKTYYHQLPLSFNYYVIPDFSVGIGGVYSRFFGAITEKETTTYNIQTQAVTKVKQIIPVKHFADSFLYKTQLHLLLQANYQWKRLSFGFRYTKDIQPYIKYTRPDGKVDEEKNQSLQFLVRYSLLQSKKF